MLSKIFKAFSTLYQNIMNDSESQIFDTLNKVKYEVTSRTTCKVVGYAAHGKEIPEKVLVESKMLRSEVLPSSNSSTDNAPQNVTIPEKVTIGETTYDVTEIGLLAFEQFSDLSGIKIPKTVINIGSKAFHNCTSLTTVNIPDLVTCIRKSTFYGCSSLSNLHIPESVTSISEQAFCHCSNLTELTLPSNLQSLGGWAFRGCSSLKSLALPSGITTLDYMTFSGCTSLASIQLPNGLMSVGECAFEDCKSLTEITLPTGLTTIGDYAFYGCSSLKSISIPNTVTTIGNNAFSGCKSLSEVNLPDSLQTMGTDVFAGCKKLCPKDGLFLYANGTKCYGFIGGDKSITEITIPEGVTYINENAFKGYNNLERVFLPESLMAIGSGAFSSCSKLTEIKLPDFFMEFKCGNIPFAVKYERLKELNKFAVKGFLDQWKKEPGCKYLKMTKCGHACSEISLIYQKTSLWKGLYKTTDLETKADEIKAIAANYEQLYAEKDVDGKRNVKKDR